MHEADRPHDEMAGRRGRKRVAPPRDARCPEIQESMEKGIPALARRALCGQVVILPSRAATDRLPASNRPRNRAGIFALTLALAIAAWLLILAAVGVLWAVL